MRQDLLALIRRGLSLRSGYSLVSFITSMLDCLGAFLFALYAFLVIGPLGFLRGPLVLERAIWYVRVLLPTGMLARSVRVAIDWRLGHFDVAIAQAEEVIAHVEEHFAKAKQSRVRKRVLGDLYTILTRAYMHAGHIDEAMRVVLRAKKTLGVDRLSGLADLDAKTAHLVRAGLAAGKLLDGGGLATMFVKADPRATGVQGGRDAQSPSPPPTQGASGTCDDSRPDEGAKIIPFPCSPLSQP